MTSELYGKSGVWCIYAQFDSLTAVSIHKSVQDAVVELQHSIGDKIMFWPFSMKLADALEWWVQITKPIDWISEREDLAKVEEGKE